MHTDNAEEEKGFVAEYRESKRSTKPRKISSRSQTHQNPFQEPIHDRLKEWLPFFHFSNTFLVLPFYYLICLPISF